MSPRQVLSFGVLGRNGQVLLESRTPQFERHDCLPPAERVVVGYCFATQSQRENGGNRFGPKMSNAFRRLSGRRRETRVAGGCGSDAAASEVPWLQSGGHARG